MILAHSFIIHMLYGGFFGWVGVLGALAPDLAGSIGWVRKLVNKSPTNWWYWMPFDARECYGRMHSLQFLVIVLMTELCFRVWWDVMLMYKWEWIFEFAHGRECTLISPLPEFSIGYFTHIVSDLATHRGDPGRFVRDDTGTLWGVNWWETKFLWSEWIGLALVLLILFFTTFSNVVYPWM